MRWVLLWSVLVVAAAIFLTLAFRRLWRQVKALKREIEQASRRMSEVSPASDDR